MTILAQVRHVFAKDVREARWSLLIYIGVVVAVTLRAIHKSLPDYTLLVVVIPGIVMVAIVTMSDSPTQPDAFWASRPLHPLAVLGAKLLMAFAIVLGLPLVGQWIGLVRYDVGAQQLAVLMGKTAWAYASWLLIGMMVAALTRDMRSFLVSLIALPFLFLMVVQLKSGPIPVELSVRLEQILIAGAILGSALLLAYVYRKRDRRVRAAAAVVALLIVVSLTATSTSGLPSAAAASPSVPRVRVHLELNPNQTFERDRIEVAVVADSAPRNERIVLSAGFLSTTLSDGSTLRLPVTSGAAELTPFVVPEQQGITWFGLPTENVVRTAGFAAPISAEQRSALSSGIRSAGLDVQVETLEPSIAATIPLISGARSASRGREVRVVGYSQNPGELALNLTREIVGRPQEALNFGAAPKFEFALVNRERGQATPLFSYRSYSGRSGALVLPGVPVRFDTMSFRVALWAPNQPRPPRLQVHGVSLDEDWLRGARLMIFDWKPLGTYPVRVEWPEKPRG
jgi:hypothetical protein